MLFVPAHKPLNRHTFPRVTFALLLVNVLVFFGFQAGDGEERRQAVSYYLDSSLPGVEWPAYKRWVARHDREAFETAQGLDAKVKDGEDRANFAGRVRLLLMEHNAGFQTALADGRIVPPSHPDYEQWQAQRQHYEALREQVFTERYMLRYDDVGLASLFLHQFMHAGFGHLLGNMVFLVMLGLLVEGALGGGLFLGAYLISGLGAAGAMLLLHWGEASGALGASGAIAGLMGLYAVLYNLRPVRFFYWAFVYFDYVRKPAIVLLPLWLGWELVQMFLLNSGRVAYGAHVGGIVTGAVLGGLVLVLGWERRAFLDEDVQRDTDRDLAREAMDDLAALRVAPAKAKLKALLPRHGDDLSVLRAYYAACKLRAGDPDLAGAAQSILDLPGDEPASRALVIETAGDFASRASSVPLPDETLVGLVRHLLAWNERELAGVYLEILQGRSQDKAALQQEVSQLNHSLAAG